MRLGTKLTIGTVVPLLVVVAVYAAISIGVHRTQLEDDARRDHQLTVALLVEALAAVEEWQGQPGIQALVTELDARKDDLSLSWIPAGSGPIAGDVTHAIEHAEDGSRTLITTAPVADARGVLLGTVVLVDSLGDEDEIVRARVLRVVLAGLAMVVVAAGTAWVTRRVFLAGPMRALHETAAQIGAGDFGARVSLDSGDELAELGQSISMMAGDLAAAASRVEEETTRRIAALEQLRHAERLSTIGKLASGVAHELGTPLNVIAMRARMIEAGEDEPERDRANARVISEQSERMAGIIRQLLGFARQRPRDGGRFDLARVGRSVAKLLAPLAAKQRVTLQVTGEAGLDVEGDYGQAVQAVTNIVVNALQVSDPDTAVGIAVTRTDGWACLEVSDEGPGVTRLDLPHLFEPFFTTKQPGEGTGLGLSIAQGIVEEHGGSIIVGDAPGGGARFTLRFPLESTRDA